MYRIEKYKDEYKAAWNDFIEQSKNGTFLFNRNFMEYHNDRFEDFSLLIFDKDKLVGVFPANIRGRELFSHQGLTYGGLILKDDLGVEKTEILFDNLLQFILEHKVEALKIKQVIPIYHKSPAYEMDYLLFKKNAALYRRDMNMAIDYAMPLTISGSKMKHYRRVSKLGLEIRKENNFKSFWEDVLVPRLTSRYNVNPVHSLKEIELLHSRFPENIIQYNVYKDEGILAGITLFDFGNVVKSQYGATTDAGEELRALDYLFITLINEYKGSKAFFDMGTPNENEGRSYNKGLLKQKEELGCKTFVQDFYKIEIA